jgi:transglutaminase-like putative cysteine protease
MDWPEQQVQIIDESISPEVRSVTYRTLDSGAKQMLVNIPRLGAGEVAEAVLTLSIERQVIEGPAGDTQIYQIPRRVPRDMNIFLGDSPFIEARNNKIRGLAREITEGKETAWDQVRAIYDYVRANVTYRESELKGAVQALADGQGDCEAMTSLFVALCRAHRVPARMVWVTDHSYPEFYLVDDQDQGHWFPCQISGSEAFGHMPEVRPIIQKGDNYRIPETKERRRYVALQLKAAAVRGSSPQVTEIMEFVDPQSANP